MNKELLDILLENVPPFHRKVYTALCKIPTGKTITYAELAKRAGSPGAARAVGQAMAKNPFPVIIPCHRVVPSTGKLGEYSGRGGVTTKRRLLQLEGIDCESLHP
jgi:methylated-DNA-[protein]-cysteine S-methyltransferase